MTRINFIFPLSLIILLLTACGKSEKEQKAERLARLKAEQETFQKAFKVAVMPTIDCLPAYLLKDSLLYDSTKVDIRLLPFRAQMDCDTAMIGGSVQAAFSDLVRTERLKHRKKVLMHYLTDTNLSWNLIADRNSKLKKLSDISDKIVAMTRYSATDLLTSMVIKRAEPKYQVFRVQINNVFVRLKMLQNHEIDAYWFPEPLATKAMQGDNNLLFNAEEDGTHLGVLAIMDKQRRPTEEEAFAMAYDQAVDSINKHGVKYYANLIKKYMQVDDATVNALPEIKFTKVGPPRQRDIQMARNFLEIRKVK